MPTKRFVRGCSRPFIYINRGITKQIVGDQKMEYYSRIENTKLIHAMIWVKCKRIGLRQSQTKRGTYCIIPSIEVQTQAQYSIMMEIRSMVRKFGEAWLESYMKKFSGGYLFIFKLWWYLYIDVYNCQ